MTMRTDYPQNYTVSITRQIENVREATLVRVVAENPDAAARGGLLNLKTPPPNIPVCYEICVVRTDAAVANPRPQVEKHTYSVEAVHDVACELAKLRQALGELVVLHEAAKDLDRSELLSKLADAARPGMIR